MPGDGEDRARACPTPTPLPAMWPGQVDLVFQGALLGGGPQGILSLK